MTDDTQSPGASTDPVASTPVAPVPAADTPREIETPLSAWVRGGTLSMKYENALQARNFEAEQRRKVQDQQIRLAKENPEEVKLRTMKLGGQQSHAMVVLLIKHRRDNVVTEAIKCELIATDTELVLNMDCPSCAKKDAQNSNFMIKQSNRRFELDTRRQGELWVNPNDPTDIVTLAGTINLTDWTRCPGLGCSWRFKIEDSVIREF